MSFLLKLVLIVLLNETFAYITQDTEIILLPASNPIGAKEIPLTLKVFGQLIKLNLRRNDQIVSSASEVWKYNVKSVTKKVLELNESTHCFYYHEDHISSAVINFCHEYGLEGHVFLENDTIEIWPFWNDLRPMCLIDDFREQTNLSFGKLYLIKRSLQCIAVSNLYHWDMFKLKRRHVRIAQQILTIELAVFLDAAAYNMFMLLLQNNDDMLHNITLAYVNRIQTAFNDPSLNVFINITLVRLNILKKQPLSLPVSDNDAGQLLDLFCKYANSLNFPNDNDPRHWDIALYLTGINLYEEYRKRNTMLFAQYIPEKNYTITGKTYHDGACDPLSSCAIVEVRDLSEIASSVDAVYKIGSLLGLTQEQSSTDSEMYVTWSKDSRNKIEKLWDRKICFRDQTENIDDNDTQKTLTIELAVFLDKAAYNMSMLLLQNNDDMLHNMTLAYVNRIQTAFNDSSLNVFINITLVRLNILKNQLSNLPISDGDAGQLLDLFCKYANYLNFPNDNDPRHWDIALYLTGINLYEEYRKRNTMLFAQYVQEKNYTITGKTYHDGACDPLLSCAIVEVRNLSEIASSVDAVYKIGSLLGLTQEQSSTDSEMYVTWSKDSRNKIEKLWDRKICFRDQTENIDDNNTQKILTIELAVFFDETAYHMYMPILDNDETKLHKMILAYVNQIQALFHQKSFGVSADISLVHLEIMKTQPFSSVLSTVGDDRVLLSSFCQYAYFLQPEDKNHHWDIALYLTGIDLYQMKNEQKDYSPRGRSYHNAICHDTSCGVVEFGTPSLNAFSGFQTFPTAAHEMGHLLGIKHDSDYINWPCSKDTRKSFFDYPPVKHIMADVQSHRGHVTWSRCSRNVTKELWERNPCLRDHTKRENLEEALDHSRYHDLPGREWTAKAQCQLFLRDRDANVVTLHDICLVLQCETPHKNEYVFAGPALDGTYCAHGKECRGGECVSVIEPPYIFPYSAHDNWSKWKEDSCKSNCLRKSKGVVIRRRFCEHEAHKTASCSGPYYDVALCDDSSLCTELRDPFYIYTISKCNEYNFKIKKEYLDDVIDDRGYQNPHDVKEPWLACTIFCRTNLLPGNDTSYYHYPPREEMLEVGIDPYLPDGTWCHYEDGQNYYCRQHYCLPENYSNEE